MKSPSFRLVERNELWTLEPKENPFLIKRNIPLLQWHVLSKSTVSPSFLDKWMVIDTFRPHDLSNWTVEQGSLWAVVELSFTHSSSFQKRMGFLSQPEKLVVIPYLPCLFYWSLRLFCFLLWFLFYAAINLMHFVGLMSIGRNVRYPYNIPILGISLVKHPR